MKKTFSFSNKHLFLNPLFKLALINRKLRFTSSIKRLTLSPYSTKLFLCFLQSIVDKSLERNNKDFSNLIKILIENEVIIPFNNFSFTDEIIRLHNSFKTTRQNFEPENDRSKKAIKKSLLEVHHAVPRKIVKIDKNFSFLYSRKSTRKFARRKIEINIIKKILNVAYGVTRIDKRGLKHRTTPSAGALYPIILFYLDFKNNKVYKYDGTNLDLIKTLSIGRSILFKQVLFLDKIPRIDIKNASGLIFVFGNLKYISLKYGPRGYYFTLLEAGHVLQNINIACSKLKIGLCEIGRPLFEKKLKMILGIKLPYLLHLIYCIIGSINK